MTSEGTAAGLDLRQEEQALAARCRALCERARAAGAEEAEVFGARAEGIAVRFEKGDLKLTQVDEGTSLGLRCFRAGRLGFVSTNQAGERALASAAADAVDLARISPPDPANRLPAPAPPAPPLALVRPELEELGVERAVELARGLLERVRAADPRVAVDTAELSVHRGVRAVESSAGASAVESDAQIGFQLFGMAVDGDDVGGFHYVGDSHRALADLEPSMDALADEFVRIALGNLGAGAAKSYRGPVLFSADAFYDVFIAPLVAAASAIAVQRGRSALAGRLGHSVGAPALSVCDDPRDVALAGATAFDREGQPCARYDLVREGVLQGYLYNGYAAAVEGRASTGHASGGARSVPGLGPHAIHVAPGSGGSFEQLLATLGQGLYVERFSGTVDPASGDFSGVAKSARWVSGGRLERPVRETLLSGNAFELLGRLVALGGSARRLSGAAVAPAAVVDGLSVTGGG